MVVHERQLQVKGDIFDRVMDVTVALDGFLVVLDYVGKKGVWRYGSLIFFVLLLETCTCV